MIDQIKKLEQNLNDEKFSRKSQERSSENITQTQNKIIDTLKENIKIVNLKLEDKNTMLGHLKLEVKKMGHDL